MKITRRRATRPEGRTWGGCRSTISSRRTHRRGQWRDDHRRGHYRERSRRMPPATRDGTLPGNRAASRRNTPADGFAAATSPSRSSDPHRELTPHRAMASSVRASTIIRLRLREKRASPHRIRSNGNLRLDRATAATHRNCRPTRAVAEKTDEGLRPRPLVSQTNDAAVLRDLKSARPRGARSRQDHRDAYPADEEAGDRRTNFRPARRRCT